MEDYCLVPPYVIQNTAPNVMVVLDNSGSMFNFAYSDGFTTTTIADDNMCDNSGSPCTGFTTPGTYPPSCAAYQADPSAYYKYYGYFNPDYWYTYSSNRFVPSAPKTGSCLSGERAKLASEWDGNFLNWVTMRRIDIVRKVMTGGKTTTGEGSGFDRLIGEKADCDSRGKYKKITNADLYTPYSGTRKIYVYSANAGCGGGGTGTSSFGVRNDTGGGDGSGDESTPNVAIRVPSPVEGVVQSVVGTRARLGLSFYRVNAPTPQGGFVQVNVSGGSLPSTVNQINLTRPSANTPLSETLWTVAGYFAQTASMEGGPGPRYSSGDYTINNTADPYNYGTGGQPRYPSCSKSFVLYITDGEPCADGYLPGTLKSYATGRSAYDCYDLSPGNPGTDGFCPAFGSFAASTFPTCNGGGQGGYVSGMEDVALYVHTNDLRTAATKDMTDNQTLTLYSVFAFGKGSTLLRYAAINGGFEDSNGNNQPDLQSEWDNNGDGEPDNFYEAVDGQELEKSIRDAFSSILKRASSGTAASVLASGEGSGANLIQAVFYPRRRVGNDIIGWAGVVQNLWYYVDPLFTNSSIREDNASPQFLNLSNDNIVNLYFDTTAQQTMAAKCSDTDGDGACDASLPAVTFENLSYLWEAGNLLWQRVPNTRTIYTTLDGATLLSGGFSTGNAATLASYLQATDVAVDGSTIDDAEYIIRYIRGEDFPGLDRNGDTADDFRSRTATLVSTTNVWKLGDVINSTPKIASWLPLNTYQKVYSDDTYGVPGEDPLQSAPADSNHFITSSGYKGRGMVFVGANDGMLHAFKLGTLELKWAGQSDVEKAQLTGVNLGEEAWAFIPKNALPYLKYQGDPDYCHIYTVDLSPYIFDASINGSAGAAKVQSATDSSWRTILIGGMRLGGACRNPASACTDCVKTPAAGVGYSSYFALDITDENNPQLLWEFSNESLGFSTAAPAVVRVGANSTNGNWFVVLGSGPTGPINTTDYQFMGRSDQNLKFFVLDLKTGALLRTIDTGIAYAFAGSMLNSTNDSDLDYQDDALYIGYVKRNSTSPYAWVDGGIGRLFTKEDANPGNWVWSTIMDGIGPVTSSIARLQDKNNSNLWLYFGTGRFYFDRPTEKDDQSGQRRLFGIKEPCFSHATGLLDPTCTTSVNLAALTDVTNVANAPNDNIANDTGFKGWYINLDLDGSYTYQEGASLVTRKYLAERVITDPLAASTGVAFFTTYKPYNEDCAIGGKSFIWAVKYNTGGAPGALLKGKALIQVSTGSIEQVDISTQMTESGDRKSLSMEGVPPTAQGLSILTTPPPVNRFIHKIER